MEWLPLFHAVSQVARDRVLPDYSESVSVNVIVNDKPLLRFHGKSVLYHGRQLWLNALIRHRYPGHYKNI